jgi:hypothetical protein
MTSTELSSEENDHYIFAHLERSRYRQAVFSENFRILAKLFGNGNEARL